jgi:hypothetical protein
MAGLIGSFDRVAVGNWQRDYLFKVTFPELPALVLAKMQSLGIQPDAMDLYVLEAPGTGSKVEVKKLEWGGQWANFPVGLTGTGECPITFGVDESTISYQVIQYWRQLSGKDSNGATVVPKALAIGQMMVTLYGTDKETPGLSITLKNFWFNEVGELALKKDGNGLLQFKTNAGWDKRFVTFPRR